MPDNFANRTERPQGALAAITAKDSRPLALPERTRPRQATGDTTITPAFLLWVFQQWWKIGIPVGIVLAGLATAGVLFFHVPKYEAVSMVIIESAGNYIAFSDASQSAQGQYNVFIQTQLEILRSLVVLEKVIARPDVASIDEIKSSSDPVETLVSHLTVRQRGSSEIYNVSYVSRVPEDAAKIVNAIVKEYLLYNIGQDADRTRRVIDILEEERLRRATEVERLRNQLVALSEELTGKDPYSGATTDFSLSANPLSGLFHSITDLDMERALLKAHRQYLTESRGDKVKDPLESSGRLEFEVDNFAETRERKKEIAEIEAQLEQVKEDAVRYQKNPQWEANPTYVALQKELKQRQEGLEEFKNKLGATLLKQIRDQKKLEQDEEIAGIDRDMKVLESRSILLSNKFKEQLNQRKTGEGKSVQLEFARAELARAEKVFESIAQRKLALQTEMRAPARIKLIREADTPKVAVEPIPYKLLFLACAAALCAPFGLALAKECLDRRVSDVDLLAQESRLRILGEISELPVRHVAVSPRKMVGRVQRDAQVFAESINSLRTNLFVAEDLRDKQVFAVTSPCSGESKSSVAVSLAMSIANATARPTLIIDADMRSPDVASMLKTKSQPGLFELLSGECKLEEAIQHVGDSSLYVIAAGRATRSTHHLVKLEEMKKLLDRLRPKFSSIVVDTPPILGASESIVLAKSADAALLCSLAGTSKVKQVKMAVERLEHAGVNLAGAVLSGSSISRYSYRYGYYPIETTDS